MRSGYAPTEQEVVMEDSGNVAALSSELARRIGLQRYELWFGAQTQIRVAATCLTIQAASAFVRDWLQRNFLQDIRASWVTIVGPGGTVEFAVDEAPREDGEAVAKGARGVNKRACDVAKPQAAIENVRVETDSVRASRLVGFVAGASNEYALRAAELTASGRQQASPVVFYGPTGVGKTHLLRAIHSEYRRRHPHSTAVYLTAEQFTTCFVEALRGSGLPSFRQKCRGANLLLIDDLQFFVGKQRTIEELQHTIDTLLADGRQLVLASDRSLAELRGLGPELVSRLVGGLTCEIEPPEFATRLGIARQMTEEMGLALDDEALCVIAREVTVGARELRGALNRIQAMSLDGGEAITRAMVERAVEDLERHTTRPKRLTDVQKVVCEVFNIEPADLRSDRKGRALAEPRMLAMWLARKYTRAPLSEIGHFFGRRSHSTVISAQRRVKRLLDTQAKIGVSDRTCGVEEAIRKLESALRTG